MKRIKSNLKVEYFAGDCLKVIGEMCHQLCDHNKFQNAEILSIITAEISYSGLPKPSKSLTRPVPSRIFLKKYHSGNDLTLSDVCVEASAKDRITVIYRMCRQLAIYDGLSERHIVALIKSYLVEHIIEVDV